MTQPELEILHRDARYVVVDKPAGMLSHPGAICRDAGPSCMTLLRDQLGGWVYPVHRLDRATSGVIVFALDSEAASRLSALFAGGDVRKTYLAVVRGHLEGQGAVDRALRRDFEKADSPRVEARTLYRALGHAEVAKPVGKHPSARYTLVEAQPLTGRRHQIRRHLAHLSHPVIGDTVHGDGRQNRFVREEYGLRRLLLHSKVLQYVDPFTGELRNFEIPLPFDFKLFCKNLFMINLVGQSCHGDDSRIIT